MQMRTKNWQANLFLVILRSANKPHSLCLMPTEIRKEYVTAGSIGEQWKFFACCWSITWNKRNIRDRLSSPYFASLFTDAMARSWVTKNVIACLFCILENPFSWPVMVSRIRPWPLDMMVSGSNSPTAVNFPTWQPSDDSILLPENGVQCYILERMKQKMKFKKIQCKTRRKRQLGCENSIISCETVPFIDCYLWKLENHKFSNFCKEQVITSPAYLFAGRLIVIETSHQSDRSKWTQPGNRFDYF